MITQIYALLGFADYDFSISLVEAWKDCNFWVYENNFGDVLLQIFEKNCYHYTNTISK